MARLTGDPIECAGLMSRAVRPEVGAALMFWGVTRKFTLGQETEYLVYEAYPEMAVSELEKIEKEACRLFQLATCWIEHRLGIVPAGEPSVVVVVSSAHRGESFEAVRWVMDELKQRVPIWKKEVAQQESRWVANQFTPGLRGHSDVD